MLFGSFNLSTSGGKCTDDNINSLFSITATSLDVDRDILLPEEQQQTSRSTSRNLKFIYYIQGNIQVNIEVHVD